MGRIAKKPRSVKGKKEQNEVKSLPRYTIRKDSLGRRYAIEKRTGQRVSVYKAEKERTKRAAARKAIAAPKKTRQIFRGITAQKPSKRKISKRKRSEAAKKGWETRRRREAPPPSAPIVFEGRPPSFGELIGPYIPEGMKMHIAGGVADRAAMYPKVAVAADFSWINLQVEAFARQRALSEGQEPPPANTPRFDRIYGQGHGAFVRGIYARATDLQDIDQMVDTLENDDDYDYSSRELYTLYFSPEVA
jgi:hypothetical protein